MPFAVVVKDLSKQYHLGIGRRDYTTIRESFTTAIQKPFRRSPSGADGDGSLWALRDVTFDVAPGEVVGLIGRNGAGKTTILKILSRITKPTGGHAEIRGRVGALLEVGTGFHPELSGRENIFLSGAILGMKRSSIVQRFDEIVDFSELEKFLETPLKRYSSGMRVRLAFAVAAHLEPEILIVDEVLAVGDVAFQRKCLAKMGDITSAGRTILFVSHNMAVLQALCRRGILFERGLLVADGPITDTVQAYLQGLEAAVAEDLRTRTDRRGWKEVILAGLDVLSGDGELRTLTPGQPARFGFHLSRPPPWKVECRFVLLDNLGHPLITFDSAVPAAGDEYETAGQDRFECFVEGLPLVPGRYRVDVTLRGAGRLQDQIEAARYFDVEPGVMEGRPVAGGDGQGSVVAAHSWRAGSEASARMSLRD